MKSKNKYKKKIKIETTHPLNLKKIDNIEQNLVILKYKHLFQT